MRMKIYATLITILCIFLGKEEANAQNKTFGYRWNMHTTDYFQRVEIDSTENTPSTTLWVRDEEKGKIGTLIPVYQLNNGNTEITASIKYKTLNCQKAFITLNSIGDCEQILKSDTIELPLSETWKEVSKKVKIKDALLLNVFIEGVGSELAFNNIRVSSFKLEANGVRLKNETAPKNDNTPLKKAM